MQDNDVINYIKRAFELKSQECYKQAIEMLYKALETENDNIEILYQIAELYYLLYNFDRAEQYLEKVLQMSPEHIRSLKLLRSCLPKLRTTVRNDMLSTRSWPRTIDSSGGTFPCCANSH